jgi:hypothetical protein
LTALVGVPIGSTPGVAVIVLLRSDSRVTALAIAAIVLLTMAAYSGPLLYAGRSFERRLEIISRRFGVTITRAEFRVLPAHHAAPPAASNTPV